MTTIPTDGQPLVLEGAQPGKSLLILAGVHGNEPCGVRAIERFLLEAPQILAGSVTFVVGNPEALAKNKRYLDANLNRLFKPDEEVSEVERTAREYARSRELLPLLSCADAVLDIHSSQSEDATPFIICGPSALSAATALPFDIVSYGWEIIEPGGSESFMERLARSGICVECGTNDAPEAAERAYRSIVSFLRFYGATAGQPERQSEQRILYAYGIYKTKKDFVPTRMFADFEPVKKGMLIGTDGATEVRATEDALILFVRKREGPNEEAFIIARED